MARWPMPDTKPETQRQKWQVETATRLPEAEIASMSDEQVLAKAAEFAKSYADKKFKNGTAIEWSANTVHMAQFEKLNDEPFNTSDRGMMVDAVESAQQKLQDEAVNLSIADIQAISWCLKKARVRRTGSESRTRCQL